MNVPKYRSFQYRLLNSAIVTNVQLKRWKIKQLENCTFGCQEKETYLHLFIFCTYVRKLWLELESFMDQEFGPKPINFSVETVMSNKLIEDPKNIKNFICLLCKQYIYRQRCFDKKLFFSELKQLIFQIRNIEKYIPIENNCYRKHVRKWSAEKNY